MFVLGQLFSSLALLFSMLFNVIYFLLALHPRALRVFLYVLAFHVYRIPRPYTVCQPLNQNNILYKSSGYNLSQKKF